MASEQNAKAVAARIDPKYIRSTDRFRLLRRAAILLCCMGALIAWGAYARRGDPSIYSPGHVTFAHSMWNGDCSWCHEPEKGGGFSRTVSDNACLRCHDAAGHHPNQTRFIAASTGGPDLFPRSANCIACHVEHRGHELLRGGTDAACTQCHGNIVPETNGGSPYIHANVTGFGGGVHPEFGRSLTTSRQGSPSPGALHDPTPLRYNHKFHQETESARTPSLPGQKDNCTSCHRPAVEMLGGTPRWHIGRVNYQRDCASCHKLELMAGSGLILPHQTLAIVRPVLRGMLTDVPAVMRDMLDAMPEAQRAEELGRMQPPPPRPGRPKPPPLTPEQRRQRWIESRASAVSAGLKQWFSDVGPTIPGFGDYLSARGLPAPLSPESETQSTWNDVRVVEYMASHRQPGINSFARCDLCHGMTDDRAAVLDLKKHAGPPIGEKTVQRFLYERHLPATAPTATASAATEPATAPATQPAAITLDTLPTGFTGDVRHWFVNSRFDHRAHRAMSCVDCHGQAKTSAQTSDVLMPTMSSCATCHAAPTKSAAGGTATGGAGTSCLLCHSYHDRAHERPPDGPFRREQLLSPNPPASANAGR
jgi:hypothetical protein